jgi:hypothetical protein
LFCFFVVLLVVDQDGVILALDLDLVVLVAGLVAAATSSFRLRACARRGEDLALGVFLGRRVGSR